MASSRCTKGQHYVMTLLLLLLLHKKLYTHMQCLAVTLAPRVFTYMYLEFCGCNTAHLMGMDNLIK